MPCLLKGVEVTGSTTHVIAEVRAHLNHTTLRAIAMQPVDGLARGAAARGTGGPISIPVGPTVLGRLVNVLGQPMDRGAAFGTDSPVRPIHRAAPANQRALARVRGGAGV